MNLPTIITRDAEGNETGILVPIWNSAFDHRPVGQVYITTILPGKQKGPHLHLFRAGAFTVLVGRVLIVTRQRGFYEQYVCDGGFKTVHVPLCVPACLYNIGSEPAMVLNCPSEPWRDNSDEHVPMDWDYEVER